MSFSVSDGIGKATPGRLTPLWLSTVPPTMTEQTARPLSTRSTRNRTWPSSMRTSLPASSTWPTTAGATGRSTSEPSGPTSDLLALRDGHWRCEISDAQLRPLKVGDERQRTALVALDAPHGSRPLRVLGLRPVRKVEPDDVGSGVDELVDAARRRRPERRDDLRPAWDLDGHPVQRTAAWDRYLRKRGKASQPG